MGGLTARVLAGLLGLTLSLGAVPAARGFLSEDAAAPERALTETLGDAAEGNTYEINGVSLRYDSSDIADNCYAYARELYELIWDRPFENGREKDDNYLKNIVSVPDLELTEEHLRAYVSAAEPGSVLRTSDRAYLFTYADDTGHSQLIVSVEEAGFTVLESNMWLDPGVGPREHFYTWAEYVATWRDANHCYLKYIKHPQAEPLPCVHRLTDGSAAWIPRRGEEGWRTDCSLCGAPFAEVPAEDGLGLRTARYWMALCEAPYRQAAAAEYLTGGSRVFVNAAVVNAYGELWYRCSAGWLPAEGLEAPAALGSAAARITR